MNAGAAAAAHSIGWGQARGADAAQTARAVGPQQQRCHQRRPAAGAVVAQGAVPRRGAPERRRRRRSPDPVLLHRPGPPSPPPPPQSLSTSSVSMFSFSIVIRTAWLSPRTPGDGFFLARGSPDSGSAISAISRIADARALTSSYICGYTG